MVLFTNPIQCIWFNSITTLNYGSHPYLHWDNYIVSIPEKQLISDCNYVDICCLQSTFEKLENEMKEVNTNHEALKRNFLELTELKHILRKTQNFFDEVSSNLTLAVLDFEICIF